MILRPKSDSKDLKWKCTKSTVLVRISGNVVAEIAL